MTNGLQVDDKDQPQGFAIACGGLEQLAMSTMTTMRPGEKLADRSNHFSPMINASTRMLQVPAAWVLP